MLSMRRVLFIYQCKFYNIMNIYVFLEMFFIKKPIFILILTPTIMYFLKNSLFLGTPARKR